MMATMVGPERFRKGTGLYFERHGGEAATCEDFVKAIEEGAGIDLTQFRLWYGQAGTPRITARIDTDDATGDRTLHLSKSVPPTPGQPDKAPMLITLRIKAFDRSVERRVGKECGRTCRSLGSQSHKNIKTNNNTI